MLEKRLFQLKSFQGNFFFSLTILGSKVAIQNHVNKVKVIAARFSGQET